MATATAFPFHRGSDLREEDEAPPVLPPRNYRMSLGGPGDRYTKPPAAPPPAVSYSDRVEPPADYDATPKADHYADQLRQQARRISQSHSSLLAAARYQSKPLPDPPKTTISVSRPVDKPPSPQETRIPQPLYRAPQVPQHLNFVGLSSDSDPSLVSGSAPSPTSTSLSMNTESLVSSSVTTSIQALPSPQPILMPPPVVHSPSGSGPTWGVPYHVQYSTQGVASSESARSPTNPLPSPRTFTPQTKYSEETRVSPVTPNQVSGKLEPSGFQTEHR